MNTLDVNEHIHQHVHKFRIPALHSKLDKASTSNQNANIKTFVSKRKINIITISAPLNVQNLYYA